MAKPRIFPPPPRLEVNWWRAKPGWDKALAFLNVEVVALEEMKQLFELAHDREMKNFQRKLWSLRQTTKELQHLHQKIRLRINAATRRYAELKAQFERLDDALKRGQLALSPQQWLEYRKRLKRGETTE